MKALFYVAIFSTIGAVSCSREDVMSRDAQDHYLLGDKFNKETSYASRSPKSYNLKNHNVPQFINFYSIQATGDLVISVSNDGDVPVEVEVLDSNSNIVLGSFTIGPTPSYTAVRYLNNVDGDGHVQLRVRKTQYTGRAWGYVMVTQ